MKVIAVERMCGVWPDEAAVALVSDRVPDPGCFPATLLCDSAIVRKGTPLFVPDFAKGWVLEVVPAVMIKRLGKSIPVRFANRYYDSLGVMVRLLPGSCFGNGHLDRDARRSMALAGSFDGALCAGGWVPFPGNGEWSVNVGGWKSVTLGRGDMCIDEAISLLSRYIMLKTGDIVIPCHTGVAVDAVIDSKLEIDLNGERNMDLKIK